ncbi:MAG: pyruvate carboxylase [Nitriliruptorales bacterium]|nr:pyruvate carboxylase [Nitriliruptorales bacterium]
MLRRVLVANRGEIAIRAFRAAYELGIATVAVYTHPDRSSLHRSKADEAYEIGDPANPLRGYLDADLLVEAAVRTGADAVYPGYGFLSESDVLAQACADAGVMFVGPPSEVLRLTGDKLRAREAAARAGLPVLKASDAVVDPEGARHAAEEIGYPVFVKAAGGGGGRGLRRVERPADLPGAVETAMREAQGAFGNPTVFLEQAIIRPRHIEVQLLADGEGNVVHLYERDCSIQRRHQKALEVAPAPNLDPDLRARLCADAVAFAREVGYRNAGTAEFLLAPDGRYVFIEMNPRIQVEHTVTEETTDVDIVRAQMQIAGGATLEDLDLHQDRIQQRGCAIQCRITTEDPANGFRPDTGRIVAYRSPGGAGIRLDAGSAYAGAEVSPYFDSMLVKLTARGRDLQIAAQRARRALAEFRIRGVRTNVAFLAAVLADPDFLAGNVSTSFLDERPALTSVRPGEDRATRLLQRLADITVNRPHGASPASTDPAVKLPDRGDRRHDPPPDGSRQRLRALGPAAFARELRAQVPLAVTDTTLRDAHQSLFATRMRTADMLAAAPELARGLSTLLSFEVWGGATFDASLRFLHEDPWDRLVALREALPNVCLQMLLRGDNLVGYTTYPPEVVRAFVEEARACGIDIFRVFDALNDVERMRPAIEAVRETGGLAEGTLCYTGDLLHPDERRYTLDHYLSVAEGVLGAGAHVLCIKDMAGVLKAASARVLVTALRDRFDAPVHLHTHDSAGGQLATYLAAVDAGVDAVDGAAAPMSGMTSQPSLAAIVAAVQGTARATGLSLDALADLEPYWEAVRTLYQPFEAGLRAPTGAVYLHEIPGGQLSNLRQQAVALGLGERFEEVERLYARCDELLGGLIKVTPTSKVVGDFALSLASAGIDPDELESDPGSYDLPASVIGFLQGELGVPPFGWPEPFRTKVLQGKADTRPPPVLDAEQRAALADATTAEDRRRCLSRLLLPAAAGEHEAAAERYGDVSVLPTRAFLYGLEAGEEMAIDLEPGVRLLVRLEAVGETDERGLRTVLVNLNGQTRPIEARDRSVSAEEITAERADPGEPGHVAAPLTGVVTLEVAEGDVVKAGEPVASIEAMKMESAVSAPVDGVVERLVVAKGTSVEPGDLLMVLSSVEG